MYDAHFADLPISLFGVKNPRTGETIEFELKPGDRKYLYYQPKGSSVQLCYTPHPDTKGWYFSWAYKPIGKGARTGQARRWRLTKLVAHRRSQSLEAIRKSKQPLIYAYRSLTFRSQILSFL